MEAVDTVETAQPTREERFMRLALAQGRRALEEGEIPVGCVFVDDNDQVLAVGHNETNATRNGTRHAELVAMDKLFLGHQPPLPRDTMERCELYVTCEPCIMCAAALSRVGIKKVHFGCFNDRFGGNGSILSIHNDKVHRPYEIVSHILHNEAIELFQDFYKSENRRAPEAKRKRKFDKNGSEVTDDAETANSPASKVSSLSSSSSS